MKHDRRKRQPAKPTDPWSDANPADVGPQTAAQLVGQEMRKPKGAPPNVYHRQRKDYFQWLAGRGHINGEQEAKAKRLLLMYEKTLKIKAGEIQEAVDKTPDPSHGIAAACDVLTEYRNVWRALPAGPTTALLRAVIEKGKEIKAAGGKQQEASYADLRRALDKVRL